MSSAEPAPDNPLVRVAALQFEPVHGDVDANLRLVRNILLSDDGPRPEIVVLPEMALTGYIWSDAAEIMPHAVKCSDSATHAEWIRLAEEYGSWLVIGHPAVDAGTGMLRNRCTLVSPTEVVGHYDKTCLYVEDLTWATAGDAVPPIWDTPIGRVAPLICADLDYPEPIESALARGAQAILLSTGWVSEPAPSATWLLRAAEYSLPIIAADLIGTDRGVVFSGGSCIIDRNSIVLASNDYSVGLVSAELALVSGRTPATSSEPKPDIQVHRLSESGSGITPKAVTISVWSGELSSLPAAPPSIADGPHLIVLPTTGEARDAWITQTQDYSSRHDAFVVQGRQPAAGEPTETLIVTPDTRYVTFTSSATTPSAALIDVAGVVVGVMPNSELASNTVSRALSVLGASIILGQGAHALQPPRVTDATEAPFLQGLGEGDPAFAHPVRFRAGDANVWIGFCSETNSVPSGIFSPDHVAWPRNERLAETEQWISQSCSVDPADPVGSNAVSKPLVSSRNLKLYEDTFNTTITHTQWLTSRSEDQSHPAD